MRKIFLALITILLSAPISVANVSAVNYTTNNFYFDDFTADYFLYRDESGTSHLIVHETLTAVFPSSDQNHGITRVIPFTNQNGKNLTMESDNTIYIDVERNGEEETVSKVELEDGCFIVYIGDKDKYVHGEQVYDLTYEFQNVITDFDEWQELYWDANGNDWSQRFNQVTARVHLDKEIASAFTGDTSCYVGRYGASGQNRCETKIYDEEIEWADDTVSATSVVFTAKRLSSGENLTFDLQFDPKTFALAPAHFDFRLVIATIIVVLGGIAMIIPIVLCLRQTRQKRQYYKGLFVKPEYTPVADITVAEMAANYIGKGGNGNPKVATLLELAVNHKIELIKSETEGAFGKKRPSWKVRIKTDTLNKQQASVLKLLAGSDASLINGQEITIKTHTATSELMKISERFTKSVQSNLEKKGLAIDSNKKSKNGKKKFTNMANILSICASAWLIVWIFGIVFIFNDVPSYITVVGEDILPLVMILVLIATLVPAFVVAIKNHKFVTHTEKGLEYSRYLEGLYTYMKMAEADRLKMLQSVKGADTTHQGVVKIYERLLPYAAIFKLEKSWLDEMSRYYEFDDVVSPAWYIGVGAFSARDFSAAMMSVSSTTGNSIIHSTTSNSSSGFSGGGGGGFSGGGGGGGGGGGW